MIFIANAVMFNPDADTATIRQSGGTSHVPEKYTPRLAVTSLGCMPVPSLAIVETLRSALSLYREVLPVLVRHVLPLVIVSEVIDAFDFSTHSPYLILAGLGSWLVMAWANAHGLRLMLQARHAASSSPLTVGTYALFVVLSGYTMLTALLATFLLLVPAFVLMAATVLSPVFVLNQKQGPFEAVATSAMCTKDNLFPIACIIVCFWLTLILAFSAIAAAADFAGILSQPITFVASVAMAFAGFFHYAIVVVLFERLRPSTQPDLREKPRRPVNSAV